MAPPHVRSSEVILQRGVPTNKLAGTISDRHGRPATQQHASCAPNLMSASQPRSNSAEHQQCQGGHHQNTDLPDVRVLHLRYTLRHSKLCQTPLQWCWASHALSERRAHTLLHQFARAPEQNNRRFLAKVEALLDRVLPLSVAMPTNERPAADVCKQSRLCSRGCKPSSA